MQRPEHKKGTHRHSGHRADNTHTHCAVCDMQPHAVTHVSQPHAVRTHQHADARVTAARFCCPSFLVAFPPLLRLTSARSCTMRSFSQGFVVPALVTAGSVEGQNVRRRSRRHFSCELRSCTQRNACVDGGCGFRYSMPLASGGHSLGRLSFFFGGVTHVLRQLGALTQYFTLLLRDCGDSDPAGSRELCTVDASVAVWFHGEHGSRVRWLVGPCLLFDRTRKIDVVPVFSTLLVRQWIHARQCLLLLRAVCVLR